jgi:hypothetical protein
LNASEPSVNAGTDQTITLPVNSVNLVGIGTDADGDTLQYKWSEVSGPTQYTFSDALNDTTNVTGLKAGTYTFALGVSDGYTSASDQVVIKVLKPPVDVQNNMNADNIVYPNPVVDRLYIKTTVITSETSISVIDQTGRIIQNLIFEPGTLSMELDFSQIKEGFYLVQIRNSNKISTYSVVKN